MVILVRDCQVITVTVKIGHPRNLYPLYVFRFTVFISPDES